MAAPCMTCFWCAFTKSMNIPCPGILPMPLEFSQQVNTMACAANYGAPLLPPQIHPGTNKVHAAPLKVASAVHPLIYRVMPKSEDLKSHFAPNPGKPAVVYMPHLDQQGNSLSRNSVQKHTKYLESVRTPQGSIAFQTSDYKPFPEFEPTSSHLNAMQENFARIPAGYYHLQARDRFRQ